MNSSISMEELLQAMGAMQVNLLHLQKENEALRKQVAELKNKQCNCDKEK